MVQRPRRLKRMMPQLSIILFTMYEDAVQTLGLHVGVDMVLAKPDGISNLPTVVCLPLQRLRPLPRLNSLRKMQKTLWVAASVHPERRRAARYVLCNPLGFSP
jgi:hypothetical protein